jgi:diguanylate cyclase (GGDEF)-like protein
VNDTLGHDFGDELLCSVSSRLAEQVQEPAVVARFGGDEFTILLPKVESLHEVVEIGEKLLAVVSEPYLVRGQSITIGASAGATFADDPPDDAKSLVRDADAALYHAKDRGRGRVEAFDARLLTAIADRVRVERTLRDALDSKLLRVEYQPVVRLDDGVAIGAEALARCSTVLGHDIPPATFIPVAEEVGLIPRLFEAVLADACRVSELWNRDRAQRLVIWVNLSPSQLGSRDLVDHVREAIAAAGADPANLGFEVTERGILPDPVEAAHRLDELAELGAHLAVDDFGTGHASLGYLQELPFDTVKLDQTFVVRAGDDARSRAIVRAVVELAQAMDLSCVAEGVETSSQLDVVAELGCEVVQGYVFSPPLSADDLTAWLVGHAPEPSR